MQSRLRENLAQSRTQVRWLCFAIIIGFLMVAPIANAQQKPNILVIFGDDIGQTNISVYGKGVVGLHDAEHRPDRKRRHDCSQTIMPRTVALRVGPRSSPVRLPSARGFPKSVYRAHQSAFRRATLLWLRH